MDVSSPPCPAGRTGMGPPRIQNACEACRAAKLKCQSSGQQGICQRCLEHKRECVYRNGPRTRRPRISKSNHNAPPRPPLPGPSKTFSIDFPVLSQQQGNEGGWSDLFMCHERYIDVIIPPLSPSVSPTRLTLPSPSSSSGDGVSTTTFHGQKPQFNLESAQTLLEAFRSMLPFFPVISLPPDATVASLSKSSPFILLAMLSAASGSKSVQGHNLYDEEFRKILALKFVAGGERTVELLLGLLIYCMWFPFHLRPRSNQASRYVKMTVDLVKELELDQDGRDVDVASLGIVQIRALLGAYYLVSCNRTAWCQPSSMKFSPRMQHCCDFLERNPASIHDEVLTLLIRVQRLIEQAGDLRYTRSSPVETEFQANAVLMGLETRFRYLMSTTTLEVACEPVIQLATTFASIFFNTASILRLPLLKTPSPSSDPVIKPDVTRLMAALPAICEHLNNASTAADNNSNVHTCIDKARHIQCVILAVRLSFPIPGILWDHKAAREKLAFMEYCNNVIAAGDNTPAPHQGERPSTSMDSLEAERLIVGVIRQKYMEKVKMLEERDMLLEPELGTEPFQPTCVDASISCPVSGVSLAQSTIEGMESYIKFGCPIIDGSMDSYLPLWSGNGNGNGNGNVDNFPGFSSEMASMEHLAPTLNMDGSRTKTTGELGLHTPPGQQTSSGIQSNPSGGDTLMSTLASGEEDASKTRRPRQKQLPLFHDLWATMTMGWVGQDVGLPLEDESYRIL